MFVVFLDFSGFRAWIWGVRGPDYGFLFISPTQLLKSWAVLEASWAVLEAS